VQKVCAESASSACHATFDVGKGRVLYGPGHKAECAAPREQAHAGVGAGGDGREGCKHPDDHKAVETEVSLMVYDLSKGLAKRVRCVCVCARACKCVYV
jgi:hypothetical protein